MKRLGLLIAILILFGTLNEVRSGILIARRPGTETPTYPLTLSKIQTSVQIRGQLAITHVDEEFYNENNMVLEGFYAFQLPDGAKVDGLWLWVDGKRLTFIVKKKEDAERMYDSVVIGTRRDPAILESLGANRFQLKVWPINPKSSRRVELQYFSLLPFTPDGFIHYRYPLNIQSYQTNPVNVTNMTISVTSKVPITEFTTSFDAMPLLNRVQRISENEFSVSFGLENQIFSQDYTLQFRCTDYFNSFPALSWVDPTDTDPNTNRYFVAWHPLREDTTSTTPRDIVFVLDASGSMSGTKITAVTTSVQNILSKLKSTDRFRIVLFSSNAIAFPTQNTLLFATPENIDAAKLYITQNYLAAGSTNYEQAFLYALNADFRQDADRRMLFLSDGEPNEGVTTTAGLISLIASHDPLGVRIFPVIYYSTSIAQLDAIATARSGKTTNVENGDFLQNVIEKILLDLEIHGLHDFGVAYNNNKTFLVYPKTFSSFTSSDKLITTGKYFGDGMENATVTFIGSNGSPQSISHDIDFEASRTTLKEVGAYWGSSRIDELLAQIAQSGETKELKQSIIDLSIKHQILTPYTAFLVLETNPIDPNAVEDNTTFPKAFALRACYPNPFSLSRSGTTSISYDIAKTGPVTITVTDVLGRIIATLLRDTKMPGRYQIQWSGKDAAGRTIPPGVYFVRMSTPSFAGTLKLIIMK
jgi:Ca-activated chloride channel homolog